MFRWTKPARVASIAPAAVGGRTMNASSLPETEPALLMHYPGFVFRALCNEGHNPAALLAGTGLSKDSLSDPMFRSGLPPIRRLILNAIEETGDPHLGLRLACEFEPNFAGLPAFTAMSATTLKDALEVLNRFFSLSFPVLEFTFPDMGATPGPHEVAIRLRPRIPLGEIAYFSCISALVGCEGLCRAILRTQQVTLRAETVVAEPEGWAAVAGQLDFPVRFEADENRIYLPISLLNQPLPGSDPINHRRFVALCEDFAMQPHVATTEVARVKKFIREQQRFDIPLPQVAAGLGYSERSLRRQLERSGTSYRRLIDEVREHRAHELLTGSTMRITSIAHALGFESASNFARSFKRRTGFTPTAYRNRR